MPLLVHSVNVVLLSPEFAHPFGAQVHRDNNVVFSLRATTHIFDEKESLGVERERELDKYYTLKEKDGAYNSLESLRIFFVTTFFDYSSFVCCCCRTNMSLVGGQRSKCRMEIDRSISNCLRGLCPSNKRNFSS